MGAILCQSQGLDGWKGVMATLTIFYWKLSKWLDRIGVERISAIVTEQIAHSHWFPCTARGWVKKMKENNHHAWEEDPNLPSIQHRILSSSARSFRVNYWGSGNLYDEYNSTLLGLTCPGGQVTSYSSFYEPYISTPGNTCHIHDQQTKSIIIATLTKGYNHGDTKKAYSHWYNWEMIVTITTIKEGCNQRHNKKRL